MANIVRSTPSRDVTRFDPLRDIEDFFSNRQLRSFFRDLPETPRIAMDVCEDDNAYHVKAEIPGVKKENIHVAIDGNGVSIIAEVKRENEERTSEKALKQTDRLYCRRNRVHLSS